MKFLEMWEQMKTQLKTMDQNRLQQFIRDCEKDIFGNENDFFCPNQESDLW